jgi:hypothetical protein
MVKVPAGINTVVMFSGPVPPPLSFPTLLFVEGVSYSSGLQEIMTSDMAAIQIRVR